MKNLVLTRKYYALLKHYNKVLASFSWLNYIQTHVFLSVEKLDTIETRWVIKIEQNLCHFLHTGKHYIRI